MQRFYALMAALFFLAPCAVAEETVSADGATFDLAVPRGFCALSRANDQEKPHYDMQDRMQETSNAVLLIAVHCSETEAMRAGKPWKRWAIWLLNGPPGKHTRLPAGMTREKVVEELSKSLPKLDLADVNAKVGAGASREGIALELKTMSVVATDRTALYTGQAAKVAAADAARDIAIVTGWGAFAGRLLTVNTYADFRGVETVEELLADAREAMQGAMRATDAAGR